MACSGQQFCILLKEKKTKKYDEETTWQCTHGKDNSNNSSRCINTYNILVNIYKRSRLTVRCRYNTHHCVRCRMPSAASRHPLTVG
jgi:hypothetical protein